MWKRKLRRLLIAVTPPIVLSLVRRLRSVTLYPASKVRWNTCAQLHLGCGSNILEGWINIDLNGRPGVVPWDLSHRFPVKSDTISYIFSEHFIEHVSLIQAKSILRECHRVLRSEGILRISTPDLRMLIDEYLAGRLCEWTDVGWIPSTPCQMMNDGMRLWGHEFIYDAEELTRVLEEAAFRKVTRVAWRESAHQNLTGLEGRPFHGEIIVEAVK